MRVFGLSPLSMIVRRADSRLKRKVAYGLTDRRAVIKASCSGLPALDKKPAKIELARWNARRRLVIASRGDRAVGKMAPRHRTRCCKDITGELVLLRPRYKTLHANLSCPEAVFLAFAETHVIAQKKAFGS